MRKKSTLVVLGLLALTATARAAENVPAAAAPAEHVNVAPASVPPTSEGGRLVFGASLLPMAVGRFKFSDTFTTTSTQDAYFAYGVGVSASYENGGLPGLSIGLAPQVIFNVQAKPNDIANAAAMKELDVMVRVAYAYRVVEGISVYVAALPGYSLIIPSGSAAVSRGLVIGGDVGAVVDMTSHAFFNVGGGYQVGFQSQFAGVHENQLRTSYVRVALGGGVRF
jgi:hypothetical protein